MYAIKGYLKSLFLAHLPTYSFLFAGQTSTRFYYTTYLSCKTVSNLYQFSIWYVFPLQTKYQLIFVESGHHCGWVTCFSVCATSLIRTVSLWHKNRRSNEFDPQFSPSAAVARKMNRLNRTVLLRHPLQPAKLLHFIANSIWIPQAKP